jgi:hypothetical protein
VSGEVKRLENAGVRSRARHLGRVLVQTLGKLEPATLTQHGAALVAGLEHLCLQGSGFRRVFVPPLTPQFVRGWF